MLLTGGVKECWRGLGQKKKCLLLLQDKTQIQIQHLWRRSYLLIKPIHTVASTTKCLALFFRFQLIMRSIILFSHPQHQILFHWASKPWNSQFHRVNETFMDGLTSTLDGAARSDSSLWYISSDDRKHRRWDLLNEAAIAKLDVPLINLSIHSTY